MTTRFELDWRWVRIVVEFLPTRTQIRKYRLVTHKRAPALGRKLARDIAQRIRQSANANAATES